MASGPPRRSSFGAHAPKPGAVELAAGGGDSGADAQAARGQWRVGSPVGSPLRRSSGASATSAARAMDSGRDGAASRTTTGAAPQSAFMARQAERAHMTGLSPIEEMRLAQNELRAKAASQHATDRARLNESLHKLITMRDAIHRIKKRAKVATESKSEVLADQRLDRDMDDLTPSEALDFVESASKNENMIFLKKQQYEESVVPWYLISPHSKFRLRWDVCSVLLISYNAVIVPFQLSFTPIASSPNFEATEYLQRMVDIFFMADIVVNFFSAFEDAGRIETRLPRIAAKYLRSWFLLDFVSAFPLYYIQGEYYRLPQMARFFRLFRLFRLFRMLTITRILNRLEYALLLKSTVSSLFKFFLIVAFTSHWLSCFFFLISADDENGWVHVAGLNDRSLYDKYISAFYWSIMTMTTVGYGNVHPCTTHERIYAIVAMGLGAWIFAYGITNVVAMVSNLNATDSLFQLKMDELNDYMEARELPLRLRYEIREFFFNARMSAESKLMNEGKILGELSALLRSKIAFAINDSVLNKMPFFAGADHNFLMELALSMRMVCFPPMEEVILEGEIGEEMFFIFRGVVEIVQGGIQLGLLGQKQYFGEMAILNQNCLRTATVRTLCFCELRMLTREKFLIALTHYPAMKQRIARIVDKRSKNKPRPDASRTGTMRRASTMTSLEKVAATSAIDEKTALQLSAPTEETTLGRISQLNSNFSGSFRFRTAETDLEGIQERISGLIQQQAGLAQIVCSMEARVNSLQSSGDDSRVASSI